MLHFGDSRIVQSTGLLLAVTADERNRGTFLKKTDTVFDLPVLDAQLPGDFMDIKGFHLNLERKS